MTSVLINSPGGSHVHGRVRTTRLEDSGERGTSQEVIAKAVLTERKG